MFLGTQFPQLHKGKGGTTEPLMLSLSMRNGTRAGHQPHPPAETQMSSVGVQPPQCFRLRKGTFPASFIEDLNHILTPTASPPGAKMWEEIAAFVPAADAARNGFPRILFPNPNNKNAHSLYWMEARASRRNTYLRVLIALYFCMRDARPPWKVTQD